MPLTDEQAGYVCQHLRRAARIIAENCYDELKHLEVRDSDKLTDILGDTFPINHITMQQKVMFEVLAIKDEECKQMKLF